ncbi:long chain acyl-CoA synthetase 4 isoform X3 [Cajanus cajan]|uniref:Long-chain-fatty-acid--CoA ligase n=1 Tax=Cajanus cajan TaxID=3821 RepID=A0A151SCT1_CAJCA|nr:long chain acyl-CoA synthetase 4 isoform X3 [Cajanus cajan]KYP52620.1 Long-chain-fatty-acid--CoA ligase 1 [Cajanus cajan]
MAQKKFIIEVEKAQEASQGRPSRGPVYRSLFAKDGFPPPIQGLDCCWDVFRLSVEKYPTSPMLGQREIVDGKAGKYTWLTYKEVYDLVIKIGNSIRSCGYGEGVKCGIYGANCAEWIMSMEACNAHGLYCVPLYDTLGAGAVEFIICHAEVSIAFVEEKKIPELLKTFPKATECLRTIVSFGKVTPEQKQEVEKFGLAIYSWDEFLQVGQNQSFDLPLKKRSDICTIMYTSGTTGDPKGVLISNEGIITLLAGVKRLLESVNEQLTEKDVYISYLPLAHIFDRVIEETFIWHGASIGFWRGDVKLLIEDIGELKPTIFCAVPRVLDRVYSGLTQKISSGGFLKKTLFNFAYSYKLNNMKKGITHGEASPLLDKIVFDKIKQGLGGRVRLILSGAAPLSAHVEGYLRVVTCAHVLQGYGLTETCAGTFVSLPNEMDMLGTVGPPVPNVDVCLESVPEMGYDALASTPRGEICVKGKTLFSGYYKREDLTKEVMIDGWFHTGDIGEWQPNGSMKIIDRKKNIFKLAQGEYVAVENLENIYSQVSCVESIWIYGNSFEAFLVAVVNPSKQALEHWAQENGISTDFDSLCEDPRAKRYIVEELSKIAKEKKLKGFEFIKGVHLDPVPFDMERDLITPTYKKKRPQMLKYYQNAIDNLYKSGNKPRA